MSKEMLEDLIIEFDEMGFEPSTLCPDIEEEINSFRRRLKKILDQFREQEKVLEILKPLCEIVETPVKKLRYLKMNGVVVYTFKTQKEFDLLKEWLKWVK